METYSSIIFRGLYNYVHISVHMHIDKSMLCHRADLGLFMMIILLLGGI